MRKASTLAPLGRAIVMGKATRAGSALYWETLEEIKAGEPEGDSALILSKGTLSAVKLESAKP